MYSSPSGKTALVNARKALVSNILHHDLIDVITYGLKTGIPLLSLRTITIRVLDELAAAQAANVVAAPGGDAHGGDDGGDDENGGGGRKSDQIAHERTVQEGGGKSYYYTDTNANIQEESRPAQAAQQRPAQTPTSRATRSSTENGKRKGNDFSQAAKKRKSVNPEPMDDEEGLIKKESLAVEEEAVGIIGSDTEATSSNAMTTDSNTTASSSTTTETDSDTDTSLDKDTPWKTAQKLSIMPDLDLVDSDDDDDEDFTEYLDPAKRQKNWELTKATQIPEVKVFLAIPVGYDYGRKSLDYFPIVFVKQVIRKFNEDFLKRAGNRRAYQEMIKDKTSKHKCVYRYLRSLQGKSVPDLNPNDGWSCASCNEAGALCAKLVQLRNEEKPCLMIYPLWIGGHYYGIEFQSLDHWVRKRTR